MAWTYDREQKRYYEDSVFCTAWEVLAVLNAGEQAKVELSEAMKEIERLRCANNATLASMDVKLGEIERLQAENDELRDKLDDTECSHEDEEAAHLDTLRLLELRDAEIAELKASRDAMVKRLREWAKTWDQPINPISYDRTREVLEICDQYDPPHKPKVEWVRGADGSGNSQWTVEINGEKHCLWQSFRNDKIHWIWALTRLRHRPRRCQGCC